MARPASGRGYCSTSLASSLRLEAKSHTRTPSATAATPGNLMVMGPGGYKFGDYWKLGLLIMLWYFIVSILWVPLIWRF